MNGFLATLQEAASTASEAEAEFRRSIGARIAALEQERSFAFRRLNLVKALAEAAAGADSEASALGACRSALIGRLGWGGESEAQREVVERFGPVFQALWTAGRPVEMQGRDADAVAEPPDPAMALAAFEDWFAGSRGTPFWKLFENVMPETPLVDF